ncbi:MAG: permease prefix domain 1-containing protein, partial [Vicinamibacterales bacterium]
MRDWSAIVHRHLASVRVDERRRREISAELAAHLEDAYDSALRSGCTEAEAVACAMERVPDWSALAVAVERSADEDSIMTRQAITVLLPGTTILLAAATGMSLVVYATPADRWVDPRWQVHTFAASLAFLFLFYLLLGAIGAAWSRHAGGSRGERLAAGAFPLVLHVAMAGPAVGADMLYAFSQGAVGRHLDINFINMILVMLVAPGAALLLGVLP